MSTGLIISLILNFLLIIKVALRREKRESDKQQLKWAYEKMEKLEFSNKKLKESKEILENKVKNLERKINQYRKYG